MALVIEVMIEPATQGMKSRKPWPIRMRKFNSWNQLGIDGDDRVDIPRIDRDI